MLALRKSLISKTLEKLENADIRYLDEGSYNEVEDTADMINPYLAEYKTLYQSIVINQICHKYDIQNSWIDNVVFNYFGYEDGNWFGQFYEPDVKFEFDSNGRIIDFTELDEYFIFQRACSLADTMLEEAKKSSEDYKSEISFLEKFLHKADDLHKRTHKIRKQALEILSSAEINVK